MAERSQQDYKTYYDIKKDIGAGGFGLVFEGEDKESKELRAIKRIKIDKIREELMYEYNKEEDINKQIKTHIDGFKEEFKIMEICSNNNNNSVKCYDYFENDEYFIIIMELCDESLSELLKKRFKKYKKGLNSEQIFEIMKQLNNAFKIMKENEIIHRDLKLENILIKYNDKEHKDFTIKLTDYGCSKRINSLTNSSSKALKGTFEYMAPEILKELPYGKPVDIWALGILLYEFYYGV